MTIIDFMGTSRRGFHITVKPIGAVCNLDCEYCYYLSKKLLYPGRDNRMTYPILEKFIRDYIEAQTVPVVTFSWQGGEPTLLPLDFFRRVIYYQQKYARTDQKIINTLQTNGTLLDDDWCQFFKQHDFLIGISLDGPQLIHDAYRVDKGGAGSFTKALHGWQLLAEHGVEANVLCSVHRANQDHPIEVYHFFRDELKAQHIQFIPIVERTTDELLGAANESCGSKSDLSRPLINESGMKVTDRSVESEKYGSFLVAIFDDWVKSDVGNIFIQMFDVALDAWLNNQPGLCVFDPTCGNALALEHNGDLFSCDHFVKPEYLLGNIQKDEMRELISSERQQQFGREKQSALPIVCKECEVRFICNGGCPKNRFVKTPEGESGLNYLCAGYKAFFNHIKKPMELMVTLINMQRPPSDIIKIISRISKANS